LGKIGPKAHERKSGGWEVIYYYSTDDITGKRKKITCYGKTKSEAEEKMEQKLTSLLNGEYTEPSKITVGAWFTQWLEMYARPKVKQSTYVNYRGHIEKRVIPMIGHIRLSKLKVDTLQRFLNEQYEHGNSKHPDEALSAKTVRNIYLMIHSALKQAYKNGLIPKNYAEFVSLPTVTEVEMRVLTRDEHQRLFDEIKVSKERYKIGILICLATGIRVGELAGLQWQDIDFEEKLLKVRRTLGRLPSMDTTKNKTEIVIGTPKSKNGNRDIPIPDFLIDYLKEYRAEREKEKSIAEDAYDNQNFVICNELGCCTEPRTLQDTFQRLIKAAGIENANYHCTRHTFATRAIEAGMDIKTLSIILGHADVSTTLNKYAHVLTEQKRSAMDLVSEFYK